MVTDCFDWSDWVRSDRQVLIDINNAETEITTILSDIICSCTCTLYMSVNDNIHSTRLIIFHGPVTILLILAQIGVITEGVVELASTIPTSQPFCYRCMEYYILYMNSLLLSEHWPDPILARELWSEHWPDSCLSMVMNS